MIGYQAGIQTISLSLSGQTSMTTTPQSSLTMTFDSQLIEDFLHTADIPVDSTSDSAIAVFHNSNGDCEALVIGNDQHLYHVCREPLSDSGWNIYGVGACPTATAAVDSETLWAVGTDGALWQNRAGRWNPAPPLPNSAVPIGGMPMGLVFAPVSVGTDGSVWAVDTQYQLYRFDTTSKQWSIVTGAKWMAQAPSGTADDLWAVQSTGGKTEAYNIARYSGGEWQTPTQPPGNPTQVSVGTDGSVWASNQSGSIYRYSDQGWQQLQGAPSPLFLAVNTATDIWAITLKGMTMVLMHYDGTSWEQPAGAPAIGTFTNYVNGTPSVSLGGDGTVWCVDAYGVTWRRRQGAQSWERQTMPTGMVGPKGHGGVTEVAVGRDGSQTQGLYIAQNALWQITLNSSGTWRSRGSACSAECGLGFTNQQDTGALIGYAATPSGDMLVLTFRPDGSARTLTYTANGILKGARLQVSAKSSDAWFTAAITGGALVVQFGSASNPLSYGQWPGYLYQVTNTPNGPAPGNLQTLIRLPFVQSDNEFYSAAVDSNGQVIMIFNIVPGVSQGPTGWYANFVPLTGPSAPLAAVKTTSALLDANGWARIYATDTNDRLWVIRQTSRGGNSSSPWTWTSWHPLGDGCLALANGPGASATHELFTIDATKLLNRLWQDPVNQNWNSAELRKPSGTEETPYYVTMYETGITVWNDTGGPAGNTAVTVSVAEPVSVWESGVQYNLDATHPQTFVTDRMGKLNLSTLALDLHTAQLTFTADGFASPYNIYPPQQVHTRLSGVNEQTLQTAQARTKSVPLPAVSETLVPASGQSNCKGAASAINDAFTIQTNHNITPTKLTAVKAPGVIPTYEELRAEWAAKVVVNPSLTGEGEPRLGSWDSFWDELKKFGEDVWHAIRKGILVVESVAVDIAAASIQIGVSLAGLGSHLINFFITTIDDVAHAIVSAFRWVGAEISKAIDWLKEFFSWDDILNTKRVVDYYLNQVFSNLISDLNPTASNNFQSIVDAQFDRMVNWICGDKNNPGSDVFSQATAAYGTNSFTGTVSNVSVDPKVGSNALQPGAAQSTYHANQVKNGYASRKSDTYVRQGGNPIPGGSGTVPTPYQNFLNHVNTHLDPSNPNSTYGKAQTAMHQRSAVIKDPKNFFDTAIHDFVYVVKEFVIDILALLKDLVVELLNLAAAALAEVQKTMNHQIHIPVISWLYEKISGDPLTLLDLFSLILAIPATLMYKLIWGGPDASPPFTSTDVTDIKSKGITWPQLFGAPQASLQVAGDLQGKRLNIALGSLSLTASILYALVDFGTDIDAYGEVTVWSKFWSGSALVLMIANFAFSIPLQAMVKHPDEWTNADILSACVWGSAVIGITLNVITIVALQKGCLAKYLEGGPVITTLFSLIPLGLGIAAAVLYAKPDSEYSTVAAMGAVITPVPSLFKFIIPLKMPLPMLFLLAVDLTCDAGSGACNLIGAVSS